MVLELCCMGLCSIWQGFVISLAMACDFSSDDFGLFLQWFEISCKGSFYFAMAFGFSCNGLWFLLLCLVISLAIACAFFCIGL